MQLNLKKKLPTEKPRKIFRKETVMNYIVSLILILIVTLTAANSSWAAAKGWLIGSRTAVKIDVSTNTIEKQIGVDIVQGRFFFDQRNNNLLILKSSGRFESRIYIYDVKALQSKGKLDSVINTDTNDEVQVLFPLTGNLFYLRWVQEDGGTPEIITYDSTSFKRIGQNKTNPITSNQLMLSDAGDFLYSIVDFIKVDGFQIADFSYKSSLDVKKLFTLGYEGGISENKRGKLLISEIISRTPQLDYFMYIFDITLNKVSQKIRTTIRGTDFLMPVTNKIALHERQYTGKFKSLRLETDYQSSGWIHIFDAVAGREVGLVKVNVEQNGDFVGVTPAEDKLYFLSYGAGFSNPMLHIIDLKNFVVIKTLPMPEASMSMVFFEE